MHFDVTQRLAGSCDATIAVYTDAAFYRQLRGLDKFDEIEVVDRTEASDRIMMRVRYKFVADLPAAALAVLDPDKLTWIEETVYDLVTKRSSTKLLPDHYADRLQASATATFTTDPTGSGRSLRRVTGEVKVRMPFVGRKVEGVIVEGFEEHLADEEREVNTYLAT